MLPSNPDIQSKTKKACERCGTVPLNGWLIEVPGRFDLENPGDLKKRALCSVCWPILTQLLSETVENFVAEKPNRNN